MDSANRVADYLLGLGKSPCLFPPTSTTCIQLIERYSACGCLYFEHSVDPCSAINTIGHEIVVKDVLVAYFCSYHDPVKGVPTSKPEEPTLPGVICTDGGSILQNEPSSGSRVPSSSPTAELLAAHSVAVSMDWMHFLGQFNPQYPS